MNFRFLLILLLAILTLLGWTFVHHQYLSSRQARLEQIAELPVYVYMNEPARLDSLFYQLKHEVPEIDSLVRETGLQAAEELLQSYPDLGIPANAQQELPNILTLWFKPSDAAFRGREKVLQILTAKGLKAEDVDSQELAWGHARQELDALSSRWSNSTLFVALVVFLMLVYARLFLYLSDAAANRGMRATVLESIRAGEAAKWQNGLLIVVPVLVSFGLYHLLLALDVLGQQLHWSFFAVQFASVLAAVLVSVLINSMREPERQETRGITVSTPPNA
ncbi:MAG TPA: hypothetical protein PLK21_06645 [Candidatus Syntrophosphaera sp.]|jgi:hypothetical protein|nr:hypothetical protein [Candidatus Syntrophosphaera sp.]HOH49036.1 hypothetical protein [Candidatus Syntrophosphaera sp.]HPW37729.1 hypothetical protein [Candidatus Syntrophosphaera sp.]